MCLVLARLLLLLFGLVRVKFKLCCDGFWTADVVVAEDGTAEVDLGLVVVLPKLALLLGSNDSCTESKTPLWDDFGNISLPVTLEAIVDATDEAAVAVKGRPPFNRDEEAAAC